MIARTYVEVVKGRPVHRCILSEEILISADITEFSSNLTLNSFIICENGVPLNSSMEREGFYNFCALFLVNRLSQSRCCFLFLICSKSYGSPEGKQTGSRNPASILYKYIAGRYRPVSYPDGPITACFRF